MTWSLTVMNRSLSLQLKNGRVSAHMVRPVCFFLSATAYVVCMWMGLLVSPYSLGCMHYVWCLLYIWEVSWNFTFSDPFFQESFLGGIQRFFFVCSWTHHTEYTKHSVVYRWSTMWLSRWIPAFPKRLWRNGEELNLFNYSVATTRSDKEGRPHMTSSNLNKSEIKLRQPK